MADSIFITGIGGFIGSHLARRAIERGMRACGVDQSPEAAARARDLGAETVVADLSDPDVLENWMQGCDTVVHTAAIVRESGPLDLFRQINVEGTVDAAHAARAVGVSTFIHLSSVMVYGFDYPENVAEDGPRKGQGNPYCQTKIESEDALLPLNDPPRFKAIVVRPGDVYGPGSVPWVKRPIELMQKGMFALPLKGAGILNHVYVDNLIDGIFLAIERGKAGEAYNITDGRRTTYAEFYGRLAKLAGVKPPPTMPASLIKAGTLAISALRKIGLTKEEASPESVRYLLRRHVYSSEKARRDLGYEPAIGLDEGLERSGEYVRALLASKD